MNSKLRLMIGASFTLLAATANAQDRLELGFSFYNDPEAKTPYVYYDQLRNQQPFFYTESRDDVNTENWQKVGKYVSDKYNDSTFSKLESYFWDNGQWEVSRKNSYVFRYVNNKPQAVDNDIIYAGNPTVQRFTDSFTYNGNGNLNTVTKRRNSVPAGNVSFDLYKYDVNNRLYQIATVYNGVNDTFYRHYTYDANKMVCASVVDSDTMEVITILKDAVGRTVYQLSAAYDNDTVQAYTKNIYTYDAAGRVDSFESYYTDTDDTTIFLPAEKVVNQYNSAGKLAGWVRSVGDGVSANWIIDYKMVMGYDANGKADTARSYGYANGAFLNKHFYRFIFTNATTRVNTVAQANKDAVVLYPNPAKDVLYIKKGMNSIQHVKLWDNKGQLVMEATGDVRELNISQLAAGIYHLYADGEYGARFVKQ
ncbi:MAG TPA: T9SS type A sorting domain-containing protein [Flavipsychrobacter sp.]|nr:T9SS type A sorting domain-containing protein [Flavipsychrobacter sp.]